MKEIELSDFIVEELTKPLPAHSKLRKEIIELIRRNVHHISDDIIEESSPLFEWAVQIH